MGIHYHRARRADVLADGLAEYLATPPADPFAPDVVAVPTRGIERFLSQRLARRLGVGHLGHDGVCANVAFPSPAELLAGAHGTVGGPPDPWRTDRLTWAVAQALPSLAGQPGAEYISRYLAGPRENPGPGRLLATAGHLAGLLNRYEDERPEQVALWADPALAAAHSVPEDARWQVLLWRTLVAALGPSPALRLPGLLAQLRADPGVVALPARLSLFGPTRLTGTSLAVLAALGEHREVHLWLVDPSPLSWGAQPRSPLVSSLGRDFAAMGQRLRALPHTDEVLSTPEPPATLLGRLQAGIAADELPAAGESTDDCPLDDSVQIHACHGTARQVEVARDVVLGLLAADPTLEPRDIIIMCPDLDTFAPLFSATFTAEVAAAAEAGHSRPTIMADLRLRIADRTSEQANEMLAALAKVLDRISGRLTIGEVLDLLASPAVARRYRLDADSLARVGELTAASGVRWGLDLQTRARYSMSRVDLGTWAFGLNRMLVGVAIGEDELATFAGVLPLDDVGSNDVALVGVLAQLVSELRAAQEFTASTHSLAEWVERLDALCHSLASPPAGGSWMASHASATLRAPLAAAAAVGADGTSTFAGPPDGSPTGSAGSATPQLALADVRWLLGQALAGRPTRANFRSGGLTVASLVPMRAVPHRVVVLVGLDDGTFPRAAIPDGDDILARDPRPGERNPRTEERQLLLDAIMAATEHLVITYCGADDRTNERRPPAVPVAELIDTLTVLTGTPGPQDRHFDPPFLLRHPLQPFDPRNFTPGGLVSGRAFSHDTYALGAAQQAALPRVAPAEFLAGPLPVQAPETITLDSLESFLAKPIAYFLRNRLGLSGSADDPAPDQVPVALDGLASWAVGDRLMAGLMHGHSCHALARAERLRGSVPPGYLGDPALKEVGHRAEDVVSRTRQWRPGGTNTIRVALGLPSGLTLTGNVTDCVPAEPNHGGPALVVRASYSKVRPGKLLALWAALLAAAAAAPETPWAAVLVAQDGNHVLAAPGPDRCLAHLNTLCDLLVAGTAEPLPAPPGPAHDYAAARVRGASDEACLAAARRCWTSKFGDATYPEVMRIWGPEAPLEVLLSKPAPANRYGEGTRFALLSREIWDPVLAAQITESALRRPAALTPHGAPSHSSGPAQGGPSQPDRYQS